MSCFTFIFTSWLLLSVKAHINIFYSITTDPGRDLILIALDLVCKKKTEQLI